VITSNKVHRVQCQEGKVKRQDKTNFQDFSQLAPRDLFPNFGGFSKSPCPTEYVIDVSAPHRYWQRIEVFLTPKIVTDL
jgi:hypothetical protein